LGGYADHLGCQQSDVRINDSDSAWCLPLNDDLGLCVFPCWSSDDCPDPANEQCDWSVPNPNHSGEPGTCRYNSMPSIPTPEEAINDMPLHQRPKRIK
jgi:hypothetical protein